MRNKQFWTLLALLIGACAIPDVEIDDSLGEGEGDMSNDGGTKGPTGKAGSSSTTPGAGAGESSVGGGESGLAGEPSVGGNSSMGGNATGGSRPGGGTGGTGVSPAGAVAKFCNEVTIDGQAVNMDLRIGSGANLVHIIAMTGTCQPVVNQDCTPISTGAAVPVNLYDPSGALVWMATPEIAAGDAWLFTFYFDPTAQMVMFTGGQGTEAECASTDFSDLFP